MKGSSNAKKVNECDGLSTTLIVLKLGKENKYMNYNVNISISTIKI